MNRIRGVVMKGMAGAVAHSSGSLPTSPLKDLGPRLLAVILSLALVLAEPGLRGYRATVGATDLIADAVSIRGFPPGEHCAGAMSSQGFGAAARMGLQLFVIRPGFQFPLLGSGAGSIDRLMAGVSLAGAPVLSLGRNNFSARLTMAHLSRGAYRLTTPAPTSPILGVAPHPERIRGWQGPVTVTGGLSAAIPAVEPYRSVGVYLLGRSPSSLRHDRGSRDPIRQSAARVQAHLRDPFEHPAVDGPTPSESGGVVLPPPEAPSSLREASLVIDPRVQYTPSPDHWEDEILYSLIIDRFERGLGSRPQGDPRDPNSRHGGNLKGVISRLDYLKEIVSTIILSPVTMGPPDSILGYYGYHQYWPIHLLGVDPRIGSIKDLKELRLQARNLGMRIILDFVVNHVGPVFAYRAHPGWQGMSGPPKEIGRWQYPLWPKELRDPMHFQRRGPIENWDDPQQRDYGDFPPNLRKLDLDNVATQDALIQVVKWWIKETDIDGIRLDTYQHVSRSFWDRFHAEIRDYASRLGKSRFLLLGEIYHGDAEVIARDVGPGKLDSAYNYPAFFWDRDAIHGVSASRQLEESWRRVRAACGGYAKWLVRFLDNQDRPRFLRTGDPIRLLKLGLAYILFSSGIPFIYYGTEQAFRSKDKIDRGFFGVAREDMFPDGFNTSAPGYTHLRKLAGLRKTYAALRRGELWWRWSDLGGPGIFAFSRIDGDQEVLVIFNASKEPRSAHIWVDANLSPPGTGFVDALNPKYSVRAYHPPEGGSKVEVGVSGQGVRLLVRSSDRIRMLEK